MTAAITQQDLTDAIALKNAIFAAILALTTGGKQSYSLDTGQTKQVVTNFDLASLWARYNSALNLCAVLSARLGCGGSTIMGPGF